MRDIIERHYEENRKFFLTKAYFILRDWDDAEDAVQETYFRAIKFSYSYDRSMEFNVWMETILRRAVFRMLNDKRMRGVHRELEEGDLSIDEVYLENKQMVRTIERHINRKNAPARHILYLFVFKGMTPRDINDIVDASYANIRQVIVRFRQEMQAKYEDMKWQ